MKKILNDPYDYVDEMLIGLCAAHPEFYAQTGEGGRVIKRPDAPVQGKVGIVSGGGSGHLPIFTGYVGPGLIDACARRSTDWTHRQHRLRPPRRRSTMRSRGSATSRTRSGGRASSAIKPSASTTRACWRCAR